MNRLTLALATILAGGALAGGCSSGGGGGGGGGGIGNAPIQATLPTLTTSLLAGGANISAAITSGTVANPSSATVPSSNAFALGVQDDGTATNVTYTVSTANNADGSRSLTVRVTETGSGFEFLNAVLTRNAPTLSFRVPSMGLTELATDGTGRAFIIARLDYAGTVSRTFNNTSTSGGATLVNFGSIQPLPATSVQGTYAGYEEYLFTYSITSSGGTLTARIEEVTGGGSGFIFQRDGGPQAAEVVQTFSTIAFGGQSFLNLLDVSVPVGNDPVATGVAANAAVSLAAGVSGGVVGAGFETDVDGDVAAALNDVASTSVSHTTTLNGITQLNDNEVQVDHRVRFTTDSEEDPTSGGSIQHTLDNSVDLLERLDRLEDLLYLPSTSQKQRAFHLYH